MRSKRINGIPPYVVLDKEKKVMFHIPNGFPTTIIIPSLMRKHFPEGYRGLVVKDAEAFKDYQQEQEN